LTTTPDEPVTVQYSLGGSATAGAAADYTADAGPLVIPAGSATGTLTASIRDDSTVELTETVVLTIDSVAGAELRGGAQHTLSITDNDAAVFTIDDVQIAENGTAQFTVSLDQPIDRPVVVDVNFGNVTATGGNVDYDDTATTVTLAADSTTSQSFSVAINDDNLVELSETFTVSLSTQANLGTRDVTLTDTATGTITDNDAAAFAIGDVTVDEDGTATFVVSLDQPIDIGVAVDVSFADVSASGGNIDYDSATQTVTFAAGSTQSQSVTVAVNDDDLVELSEETFSVSLSTATSLGTRNVSLSDTATGTISDNDAATITVDDITVSEDGAAVLTIRLDQPIDTDVVVDINYTDGTATGGQVDYDSTATQVTFSAGSNSDQTVSISLNDDSLVELTESFTAALTTSSALGTRDVTVNDSASVTLTDDDAAVFTIDDVTAAENGTMVLTVSLDHPIDTAVQVDIAFTDGSATGGDVDYDSGTQSVQFAAGTTTAQTITVALNDDDLVESNESFTATLSTQTTAGTRDVTVNDSAVATITDNDVATDFGDAPAGYPVRLSEDGARHVAVGPTLGATRDAETDGTPSAAADADGADEDGVQFTQPLQVGMPAEFTVDVSDNGFINAWADWNLDGDFEDAGEQIFSNFAVTTGSNTLQTTLPADASPGLTVLRYRLTSASVNVPSPAGILPDGEVEDYVSLVELMRPRINFDSGATEDQVPVFDWDDVPGAAKYHVWLSRLTGTAAPLYQVTTTESDWMPPQPLPIGQYRIWIQAETDQGALSDWSAPVTFDVNTRVLLQIPERYQTTQRPTISWDALEGAVAYDLWVDSVSDGTSQFVRESNLTSTSFTPNTDWSLGRYRYWVRGIDEDGRPARWARFEELVVATAPQVIGPVGGIFDMTPTFTWTTVSGAATYELLLRDRLLRTDRIVDGITSTDWTPATDLEGGPWTWHVLAVAQDNARGLWSPPSDIYVGGRTTVTSPTGTTGDTTPTFTWTEVQGAVRYDLWVDKVGGPGQIIREQNLTSTSFTPATPLEAGDYRVWVQAISSEGTESPWSLEVNFTIAANEKFLGDELDQSIVTALSEQTWHVDEKSRATHIPAAAQRRVEYDSPGQARVSEAATATTEFASYVPERVVEQSPEEVIDVVADEVFSMWSERSLNDV